jgi:hypothetical protein
MRFLHSRRCVAISVRAQGVKYMKNSGTLEKALLLLPSTQPECLGRRGCSYLVRNTIYLVSSAAMIPIDRADDHLGELRDALAQMSFALMAVLTEVAAEHDLSLTQLRGAGHPARS